MMGSRPLRLLVTNAFSLSNKIGALQHAILQYNVDVAIVTETKLCSDNCSHELTIPGYSPPIRKDRDAHGGGVAVWARSELSITHHDDIDCRDHEL